MNVTEQLARRRKKEIEEFFVQSLWYGFTGTPIFVENARKEIGNLPRTTKQQYGECLHEYTVKEAIHDNAVLGFQVEYKSTFSEEELDKTIIALDNSGELDPDTLEVAEKEARLPKKVYENDNHMLEVIHSIINKSRKKLGFAKGVGQTYNAILTTSSIAQAQRYYDLIKAVKKEESSVKIDEATKRVLPDFPKVAITYSISENEEASISNQEKMKESIKDYNQEFGTNFTLETMRAYNRNINDRLARKKEKYLARSEQLDLVIVVDRLLTGFDAPCLSTLFIDRAPMQLHELIQAFSRTNRLFDKSKKYGQIVTFQTPKIFEQKVKEALILYSNGGEDEVLAPTWLEAKERFVEASEQLIEIMSDPVNAQIDNLNKADLKKFVKAFQKFDKTFTAIQVYSEFDSTQMGTEFPISIDEVEIYHGNYVNALELLKAEIDDGNDPEVEIDIEYELESIKTEEINYEYILMLIQAFVPSGNTEYELFAKEDKKATEEIDRYLNDLEKTNPQIARLMRSLWKDILIDPENYRDKNVSHLLEEMIQAKQYAAIKDFSDKWHVEEEELAYVVANYNVKKEKQSGESELKQSADYEGYKASTEKPLSKLKYWKTVRNDFENVMKNQILPLQRR
ncbi:type I restriction endonuclease subunit R [Enterococcus faecium]|uniref:type I restriction endonuclease subunit R, EcoR124 family n=1 Tax=Enterococcus TaxID=1350 RepID=UPI001CE0656E|nr:type I restriction endonuclease subunit R [Enterococcus faecium]MCI1179699.1 type I restriction endonuclease subunit R [Enterococcus faecium]MCT9085474.1 type I restriction endonuclease subunit R [Enterococcus faecium]MCV3166199.1 type I restriction endonuclease subunit R [Enterococcus faecium]MDQ8445067.1 hypothetical protein [Enterococcus faecium]MDQ8467333.1 hypothetical protein [Enterococcus faecium]